MPKHAKELSAVEVGRMVKQGMHSVGGVAGLKLQVLPTGGRTWVLRVVVGGKRTGIGLGGYPTVTLAMAREKARAAREQIEQGINPVAERKAKKVALALERGKQITFDKCAEAYIAAHEASWKNPKHRGQWRNTLSDYASPILGKLPVAQIDTPLIVKVLKQVGESGRPLWDDKTETATRLRGRIERVLDWATTGGYRSGENPARWRGHLQNLLADPRKVAKVTHHPALPWPDMAPFMVELRNQAGIGASALEFTILTAARSGEVRGATWEEINLDASLWVVPAERMKMTKEHRVPLSTRALELLKETPKAMRTGLVFRAPRGGQLSDMTLTAVLRRMGRANVVPHGFRSSFRDWASESTAYPSEVVEMALAHAVGNKVEAAYRRGDLFVKRVQLMQAWSDHCDTIGQRGAVVPMRGAA